MGHGVVRGVLDNSDGLHEHCLQTNTMMWQADQTVVLHEVRVALIRAIQHLKALVRPHQSNCCFRLLRGHSTQELQCDRNRMHFAALQLRSNMMPDCLNDHWQVVSYQRQAMMQG